MAFRFNRIFARSLFSAKHLGQKLVLGSAISAGIYAVPTVALEAPPTQQQPTHHAQVDYFAVYRDIASMLEDYDHDDGSWGPILLRLAWHSAGTYSKEDGTGGSNGGMHFAEGKYGANNGLALAREFLEPLKKKYPNISYSDLWSLAGVCAIQELGGPTIPWRPGRVDVDEKTYNATPDGRLPAGNVSGNDSSPAAHGPNVAHAREIFYRMGFDDRELAALLGAHALGRCHPDRSGFVGRWVDSNTTFSNDFFKALLQKEWVVKKTHKDIDGKEVPWAGNFQYEAKGEKDLMMLPVEIAFLHDKKMRSFVEEYAKDQDSFFKDFTQAFTKLIELGAKFPEDTKYITFPKAG